MNNNFKNLKTICLFVGPHRSGSSVVRCILNAHPNMVVSHELGRSNLYDKIHNNQITRQKVLEKFYNGGQNHRI